ncbi:g5063 [Coccomyxa viridis]|uniref:G5063 protein n=1 Tax=Coccomyxa viridis TaxID=1274662 RepID=A0ABP1FUG2_9CHLO
MAVPSKQSKTQLTKRKAQQPSQQTGLLPVLAVTAAVAGLVWWRRHKQNASQPRRSAHEQGSKFRFPKGKAAAASNARSKASTNNKKNKKDRKEEIKARQHKAAETSKPSGSKETDDKDKDPLILNYTYFVPERADKMSAPAQRMALPPKETK